MLAGIVQTVTSQEHGLALAVTCARNSTASANADELESPAAGAGAAEAAPIVKAAAIEQIALSVWSFSIIILISSTILTGWPSKNRDFPRACRKRDGRPLRPPAQPQQLPG